MGAISSVGSCIGSQIPIPASVNDNSASNPVSEVETQKNLAETNNTGTAISNTTATGESFLKGIIGNLGPTTKV